MGEDCALAVVVVSHARAGSREREWSFVRVNGEKRTGMLLSVWVRERSACEKSILELEMTDVTALT